MTGEQWQYIIDNDQAAYAKLYNDYFRKLYNYGKKFSSNKAIIEDAIQEVFLDVWAKKQKLAHIQSIDFYFLSSFRYTLFRNIKRELKINGSNDVEEEPEFSVDSIIIEREMNEEMQAKIHTALKELTSHQCEAILLRFYYNLSYEEVAAVLGITVKASYKIMARSLAALKHNLLPILIYIMAEARK